MIFTRLFSCARYCWLLLCFAFQFSYAQEEVLLDPVVVIASDDETGAGFLVGEQAGTLYFLTAYHVIVDPADIRLRFRGTATAVARLLQVHEKYDVAVISCEKPAAYQIPASFSLAKRRPGKRQAVITIGHPAGNDWDLNYRDEIKALSYDFDDQYFTITPDGISAGSSGGPVLNEQNELLGLVTTEDEIKALCVSQDLLLQMLRTWRVPTNLLQGVSASTPVSGTPSVSSFQTYADPLMGTMVAVEGGSYQRGSEKGEDDEKPVRTILVDDFYIAATEVTQAQWQTIMGDNPSHFPDCDQCPVERVSWKDAQAFINRLNQKTDFTYRLPTEAEWEYAARGGKYSVGYTYAGSDNLDEVAWHSSNSGKKTHPVGKKRANELGLYDMSGNVWEWCADWYASGYYSASPVDNPQGPSSGSYRVYRGGSWRYGTSFCRVAIRYWHPSYQGDLLGFRLARTP